MPYANRTAFARQMRAYIKTKRRLNPGSKDDYKYWLVMCGERLEWKHPERITVQDLEDLESQMMREYAETTVSNCMRALVRMLKKTKNRYVADYEVLCTQQPDQRPVWLKEDELAKGRLIARRQGVVQELLYSLMGDGGLRPVDASKLTVDKGEELLREGKATILGKGRGEGKKGLLVLSPLTKGPLKEYLELRATYPGSENLTPLFVHVYRKKTKPITIGTMCRWMKDILTEAGTEASAKDLRKTFGSMVYENTGDEWLTARMMRHSHPGTSFRHYIGQFEDKQADVLAILARRCPGGVSQQGENA